MPRGEWMRTNVKTRAEQVVQLDIRKMTTMADKYTLVIFDDGNQVQYHVDEDHLFIDSHDQVIRLDKTPCHYGGHRKWFLCPQCSKRVAILFDRDDHYLCRHCHDLPYTSQRVPEFDRLLLKVRKIRDRLNTPRDLSKPVMFKPKGMHWRTFERLKILEKFAYHDFLQAWL